MTTEEQPTVSTQPTTRALDESNAEGSILTSDQLEEARALHRLSSAVQQGEKERLNIGRRLAAIRPSWPKSGPNAVGWRQFLHEVGIEKRSAQRYMRSAAAADKVRDTLTHRSKPTLLERTLKLVRRLPANDREAVLHELQRAA